MIKQGCSLLVLLVSTSAFANTLLSSVDNFRQKKAAQIRQIRGEVLIAEAFVSSLISTRFSNVPLVRIGKLLSEEKEYSILMGNGCVISTGLTDEDFAARLSEEKLALRNPSVVCPR